MLYYVTTSHTNQAQNLFLNVTSSCPWCWTSINTGTGQRNQSALKSLRLCFFRQIIIYSHPRSRARSPFPHYLLVSTEFSSPIVLWVMMCPFYLLPSSKSQVSSIRADIKPVCVHVEEQRFRRRHACLLAVSREDLPQ